MRQVKTFCLLVSVFVFLGSSLAVAYNNPEQTQTQLLMNHWWKYVIGIAAVTLCFRWWVSDDSSK
jgi:hypothetical protein